MGYLSVRVGTLLEAETMAFEAVTFLTGLYGAVDAKPPAASLAVLASCAEPHRPQDDDDDPADIYLDTLDPRVIEAIRTGDLMPLSAYFTGRQTSALPSVPDGWTAESWCRRLHTLADACAAVNPIRAIELRADATNVALLAETNRAASKR